MSTHEFVLTPADITTLRAYRNLHRETGRPGDIASVFNLLAILAPAHLNEVMEAQDWEMMGTIGHSGCLHQGRYFITPASMRAIRYHNPEAVDQLLAIDAADWRSRLFTHLDLKQIEKYIEWEGRRGKAFRHDIHLCRLTHADWVAQRLGADEVRSMISDADWDRVRSAFAFSIDHHRIDWNVLHRVASFSVFFPTEAKELLDPFHKKIEAHLGGWRPQFVTDVSTSSLNFGRVYLDELGYLHRINPEYARKVVREEDWQLLCQQRNRLTKAVSSCVCKDTVYKLTPCLKDLAALHHLFVS